MKPIFTFLFVLVLGAKAEAAATTYNINSNTNWSSALPSYCGNCVIKIASGVTLTLNNSSMCDDCTISGGAINITAGFTFQGSTISNTTITASSSFTLDNTNSFSDVTATVSGSSSFTQNGTLSMTNTTFTFSNTASFTSNAKLNMDNSSLYFNDNSHFTSNSSTVNLSNSSKIVAGDGSKSSSAYLVFYGQLNLVDANSMVVISNTNNYYLSWNTYTSASNHKTYTTTNNKQNCGGAGQNSCSQANYYGGAMLSSTGAAPITVLPAVFGELKASVANTHSIKLSWTLTDLSGGETIQVERSNDGSSFTDLISLPADQLTTSYSYTDQSPLNGENDYRVKITDRDGNVAYSKIVSGSISEGGSLQVFPNPCTSGHFQIRFPSVQAAMVRIFSIDGRLLSMQSLNGQSLYAVSAPAGSNAHVLVVQVIANGNTSAFNLMNNL